MSGAMGGDGAREAVLDRLRRTLAGSADPTALEARRSAALAPLATPAANTIPQRADLLPEERVAMFTAEAEAVQTSVQRLGRAADLPEAVIGFLRQYNLPMELVMARDPLLERAAWQDTMLRIRHGQARDSDTAGLTIAFAGIAETGTSMLVSARARPTSLAFLPDNSIVVLPTSRVLRAYEDGIRLLREELGDLPRSVNFITGPSRTGDIEQTILLGAHGPRRLLVLLVDEAVEGKAA